jgi:hypothetical protein
MKVNVADPIDQQIWPDGDMAPHSRRFPMPLGLPAGQGIRRAWLVILHDFQDNGVAPDSGHGQGR